MLNYIKFLSTIFKKQTQKQSSPCPTMGLENVLVGKSMLCTHEYLSLDPQHPGEKPGRFMSARNPNNRGQMYTNLGSSLSSCLNRGLRMHEEILS